MTDDTAQTVAQHSSSRHVSTWIAADSDAVYEVAVDARQLPRWAAGLSDPTLAAAAVAFAPHNDLGVLDHVVRLPSGEEVYNPMRVLPMSRANHTARWSSRSGDGPGRPMHSSRPTSPR